MNKIIIVILVLLLSVAGYVFLSPDIPQVKNVVSKHTETSEATSDDMPAVIEYTSTSTSKIVFAGTFVALKEGVDRLDRVFTYLLLNDGRNIVRIDLRPLVGYSDIDIIKKLGVNRGDKVTITGVMNDDGFSIERIE